MTATRTNPTLAKLVNLAVATSAAGLIFALAACGGSGGGSSSQPPKYDVTGEWTVNETIQQASGVCAEEIGESQSYSLNITQTGSNLRVTVSTLPGQPFNGSISGDRISWRGSYADENGGTVTFTDMDVRVTDPSNYSGVVHWRWSGGGQSCTGSTSVYGSALTPARVLDNGPDNEGDTISVEGGEREGEGGGVSGTDDDLFTCGEIVYCVVEICEDDACANACVDNGTPDGQRLFGDVLGCISECEGDSECVDALCQGEIDSCVSDA